MSSDGTDDDLRESLRWQYDALRTHIGHDIECVCYGVDARLMRPVNIAVECTTCNVVLLDCDDPDEGMARTASA